MSLFRPSPVLEKRGLWASAPIPTNADGYLNASGRTVTVDTALRLGAVYACVGLIADSLSTTPIDVYRKQLDGRRVALPTPSLLDTPTGGMELVEWLFSFFSSLLLRGNTYGLKDNYDSFGYPQEVHLIHPDEVNVTKRSKDNPEPVYHFNGMEVPRRQVLHVKGFTLPGALTGLDPLWAHAQSIGMGLAAEEFGARFFGDNGHPTAVLETDQPVTQEQALLIKNRLMTSIRGRREPIVLGAGTTWKPIQVTPETAQFIDTMQYTVNDIARIYHVPAEKIGGGGTGSSITYGNREANVIEYQTDALLPNAVRFEQHFSRLLPGRQTVKFNMDAAIRVDLKTRYEAHQIGIVSEFLKINEARDFEDLAPVPWGEEPYIPKKVTETGPAPPALLNPPTPGPQT